MRAIAFNKDKNAGLGSLVDEMHQFTGSRIFFARILRRRGWPMMRLGGIELISDSTSVASIMPAYYRESFEQVCPPGYRSDLRWLKRAAA